MNSWCSLRGSAGAGGRFLGGAVDLIRSGWFCVRLKMCRMKPHRSGFLAALILIYLTHFLASLSPSDSQRRSETWWGVNVKLQPVSRAACSAWCFHCTLFVYSLSPVAPQLATWDSVHGLNGSLKESRIENGMQGVTVKVVTLLVSGRHRGHDQSI